MTLSHLCDVRFTVAVTCSLLLPFTAALTSWMSSMTWAQCRPSRRAFRTLLSYQRTSTRSIHVSPWPSGRISVWLMPSVCSCTHCPPELKVGSFYSRSFEGVCSGECHHSSPSESTVSSAYVYTHTHTHIYIMFSYLYFSCKKLSLYW